MAACSFGASGHKIPSLNLGSSRPKSSTLQPLNGFPIGILKFNHFDGLEIVSGWSRRAIAGCKLSASDAILTVTAKSDDSSEGIRSSKSDDSPEGIRSSNAASKLVLNSFEVESLVKEVCDTTSIAEFELKLGGFRLYVMRNLAVPTPASAPISVNTAIHVSNVNGSASSTSLVISKSEPSPSDIQTSIVRAADEGLVILQSPRVGFFRRSRTIKGKRAPPSCKEKQQVKEGQVLCFIEQLGGEIPIESDVSGEVVKILREDGEPVGYGDALIAILPSFPGIKNL